MPRSYATPLAFKTAVEQRLRNEADTSGMDLQRRRQLFVFDRFLARLFRILVEGAALRAAIDRTFDHRATHPVPMSVPEPPSSWAPVYERIAENDGLQWRTIVEVTAAVQSFLDPVLARNAANWRSESWSWSEATGGDEP
jgi:hypothetical protein